jgi:O-antigen/teichoic acid export membrane protein
MISKILATRGARRQTRHDRCIVPARMRSASLASRAIARDSVQELTEAENSFRNAKLRHFALVAYKAIADAAAKGTFFVITVVAARQLSSWEFGVFGLGTTIGWMLAVATDLGMQMHVARAVASDPAIGSDALRRHNDHDGGGRAGGGRVVLFGHYCSLSPSCWRFYRCLRRTSLVELVNYFIEGVEVGHRVDADKAERGGTLGLGLAVLYWRPGVNALAVALLLPAIAALAWSAPRALRLGTGDRAAPVDGFMSDVFPIGLGIVLSAVYFRVDVLLVQFWLGTEAVGGYNAVFRLVDGLRLAPAALLAVTLPGLCRARGYRPLTEVSAVVTVFAAAVTAFVWTEAEVVITTLFGSKYLPAAPALRVLALAFPLLSLNLALTHQLVGWNRQRAYASIAGVALLVNLGLNTWLIPALALEGAAWATLGTEVCVTTGCLIALRGRA